MKNMQKIRQVALLFLVLAGVTSCDKNDSESAFEVKGDVMIIKRMIDDEVQYARSYYAYGNRSMSEASVTLPEGGTLDLVPFDGAKRSYIKEPVVADFSTDQPEDGDFDFSVINEDIEYNVTDELTFTDLPIDTITSATYNNETITVNWAKSTDADNYIVRLVDENLDPLFTGTLLNNTQGTFQISVGAGNWTGNPVTGHTYFVEVQSLSFDADATNNDFYYNINEISVASKSIVWGN